MPDLPVFASAAAATDPRRLAALTLHGMAPADRSWILDRLAPDERRRMGELLSELSDLGFPCDRALVDAAVAGATRPMHEKQPAGSSASELARVLQREPVAVIQLCLKACGSEQAKAVLQQLRSAGVQIEGEGEGGDEVAQLGPALRAAIQAELRARVTELQAQGVAR